LVELTVKMSPSFPSGRDRTREPSDPRRSPLVFAPTTVMSLTTIFFVYTLADIEQFDLVSPFMLYFSM
jgi:hypothetical protein